MKTLSDKDVLLHLSLIDGIGPVTIQNIIERKKSRTSFTDFYAHTRQEWVYEYGVSDRVAFLLVDGLSNMQLLEDECRAIDRHTVSWATYLDDNYPVSLKQIHVPPVIIYWQGNNIDNTEKNIALVGSRKPSYYGKQVTKSIVKDLIQNQWTIVSGGARGIDGIAHQEAINCKGGTVVVLGSGLALPYPNTNQRLFDAVIDAGGTLLSIFPITMRAVAGNFPARNRIIAGLSRGTVVIQAAKKSGALITAQYALDQGKEVFAAPGAIDDPLSEGPHDLIKNGAKLVHNVHDILHEFGMQGVHGDTSASSISVHVPMNAVEQSIIRLCKHPTPVDTLIESTNLPLHTLQEVLFELQIKGYIKQDFSGLWHA